MDKYDPNLSHYDPNLSHCPVSRCDPASFLSLHFSMVLENIQAEQDLTRARLDLLTAIAEFNKAQYALKKAVGNR